MKKKILKGLLLVALGYVILVALYFVHLVLGGSRPDEGRMVQMRPAMFELTSGSSFKAAANYATLNFQAAQGDVSVEQKYEKIGSIESSTAKFDEAEQQARGIIKQFNALIQGEEVSSSATLRRLYLTIGVPPDNFDQIIVALKTVGRVDSFNVTKTDKTNDFLELKAKRTSLEKTRDALIGLKTQGGKIDELVKLEQEILKLEGEIQGLGVQLGQFDKVNEFCTVRFNLGETQAKIERSPYFGYLLEAINWAAGVYLFWLGITAVGFFVVILLLVIIDKSKVFRGDTSSPN